MNVSRHLIVQIAATLLLAALVYGASASSASAAQIVRIIAPTVARENPGFGPVVKRLGTTTPYGHDQLALRVLRSVPGAVDPVTGIQRRYYQVHLPYRRSRLDSSNGHVGWVSSDHVQRFTTPWSVVVNRSNRTLTLNRFGKRWRSWRVVVGSGAHPTPRGQFAIYGKTTRNHHFDGTGILPFAYSRTHAQFDGGPGMVGLHGRSGASLNTPLGTAGSNGCVRMDNRNMQLLLDRLPIGTPVTVR